MVASKDSQRVFLVYYYVAKNIVIGAGGGSTAKLGGGVVVDAARITDGAHCCAPAHVVSIAQRAKTDDFSTHKAEEEYCSHVPLNKCIYLEAHTDDVQMTHDEVSCVVAVSIISRSAPNWPRWRLGGAKSHGLVSG